MDTLLASIAAILDRASDVLMFPLDSTNRIYWLYIASSVVAALFVYLAIRTKGDHATERDRDAAQGSFLQFLFPKSVWSHPSAWLDLKYVFFHKTVSHFLLLGVGAAGVTLGYRVMSGGQPLSDIVMQEHLATASDWIIAFVYMMIVMFLLDFVAWFLHYLQHKVPLLWQFHKVHHSAEVMHPISNFREHPIDNRDVKFGVPEEEGRDLDGVLKLYWVPFRDAYRLFVPKASKPPAPPEEASEKRPHVPAE